MKKIAIILVLLISAMLLASCGESSSNGFVGVWQYNTESPYHTFEFMKNGKVILNEGSDYEEQGTYLLSDDLLIIYPDDEDSSIQEINYVIIDDDHMQFEQKYWSGYDWESTWIDLYRIG